MKLKIYISAPLKNVTDLNAAKEFYELIAHIIEESGHEVYLPHQHTDPVKHAYLSDEEVFKKDYAAIKSCDMIFAILKQDSLGVGSELGIAYIKEIPIVAIYSKGTSLSRFTLGMLKNAFLCKIIEYDTVVELKEKISNALNSIENFKKNTNVGYYKIT